MPGGCSQSPILPFSSAGPARALNSVGLRWLKVQLERAVSAPALLLLIENLIALEDLGWIPRGCAWQLPQMSGVNAVSQSHFTEVTRKIKNKLINLLFLKMH